MFERLRPKNNEVRVGNIVKEALEGARENRPLLFSQVELMELLGLNGAKPDGKILADRLIGSRLRLLNPVAISEFKATTRLVINLGRRHNSGDVTEQERRLAEMLIEVGKKQFLREGNICPVASYLLLRAPDDLVSSELKSAISGSLERVRIR